MMRPNHRDGVRKSTPHTEIFLGGRLCSGVAILLSEFFVFADFATVKLAYGLERYSLPLIVTSHQRERQGLV